MEIQSLAGTPVPNIRGATKILIRLTAQGSPSLTVDVLILPQTTGFIPSKRVWKANWPYVTSVKLADPNYHEPQPIDILLRADSFRRSYVVKNGREQKMNLLLCQLFLVGI